MNDVKEFVEKLIKRLKDEKHDYVMRWKWKGENEEDWRCMEAIEKAIGIVERLAEEHNNGWISVDDELPPRNESVLCWAVSLARGGDCCCLGSCDNGFWFMQTQIDTYSFPQQYKVVAWHKLPAPYKKGE